MKLITRPVVIESLEWSLWGGWSCSWRPAQYARGVPEHGYILGYWTLRGLLGRLNWWTTPMESK